MVGRVIGKNGETIKSLQAYTGSLIQVNQAEDPCQITISGTPQSLSLAMSMVNDITSGKFKGFALLRQMATGGDRAPPAPKPVPVAAMPGDLPMYAPGYGLIPPSQVQGLPQLQSYNTLAPTTPSNMLPMQIQMPAYGLAGAAPAMYSMPGGITWDPLSNSLVYTSMDPMASAAYNNVQLAQLFSSMPGMSSAAYSAYPQPAQPAQVRSLSAGAPQGGMSGAADGQVFYVNQHHRQQ
ncbi:hypothetical protein FOA52_004615 [Chlamydomonas sp. UWO 241]|nr:hypothetical protein FOA52_004615 [Chlamydomonas sp. UWO 241]